MSRIKKDLTKDVEQLFALDFENLMDLPCYVFWKNLAGEYHGYNDYGAKCLGYSRGSEIVGKTDLGIFLPENALIYRANDQKALKENRLITALEQGILHKVPVVFLSYKVPLYDTASQVKGMFGFSFSSPTQQIKNQTISIDNISINNSPLNFNKLPIIQNSNSLKKLLSEQEKNCLDLFLKGFTIKKIARHLKLSPRTIETYIERSKIKLNSKNKAELIVAYLKYKNNESY